MEQIAIIYLLAINVVAFFAYDIEKRKVRHGKWRISEATLIWLVFVGGAFGALLGMKTFYHKTWHWMFRIFVLLALVFGIVMGIWWAYD